MKKKKKLTENGTFSHFADLKYGKNRRWSFSTLILFHYFIRYFSFGEIKDTKTHFDYKELEKTTWNLYECREIGRKKAAKTIQ